MAKVKVEKVVESKEKTISPSFFTTDDLPRQDGSVEAILAKVKRDGHYSLFQEDPINEIYPLSIEMDTKPDSSEEPKVK